MKKQKIKGDWKIGNDRTTGCPTETLGHDKHGGFTLVELVIVIAIVIILSVISVPIYRGYVDKAKMSEGYALLGQILSAQKAYYSEHGNFLRYTETCTGTGTFWTCNETVLGIDARGNKYFTSFSDGANSKEDIKNEFSCGVIKPEELRSISSKSQFLLYYNINGGYTYKEA